MLSWRRETGKLLRKQQPHPLPSFTPVSGVDGSAHIADVATKNVLANGLSDRVSIVSGRVEAVEELQVPGNKVDVLVSEWMGEALAGAWRSLLEAAPRAACRDEALGWVRPDKERQPPFQPATSFGDAHTASSVAPPLHSRSPRPRAVSPCPPATSPATPGRPAGYALLFESMLDSVLVARDRFLVPGGAILPDRASIFVAGGGPAAAGLSFWDDVYGFSMASVQKTLKAAGSWGLHRGGAAPQGPPRRRGIEWSAAPAAGLGVEHGECIAWTSHGAWPHPHFPSREGGPGAPCEGEGSGHGIPDAPHIRPGNHDVCRTGLQRHLPAAAQAGVKGCVGCVGYVGCVSCVGHTLAPHWEGHWSSALSSNFPVVHVGCGWGEGTCPAALTLTTLQTWRDRLSRGRGKC